MIKILLIIALVLLVIILLIGLGLGLFVTRAKRPSLAESEEIEKSKDVWGDYDLWDKEEFNVESFDGYLLRGQLIKNNSNKYVIITHGWCYNRNGSVKYANIFYKLGYNVYLYDLRYFGENKKTYCSMGCNESRDIVEIEKALFNRFGQDITIGLHGESLGCASSLMSLGLSQKVSFFVADCGYADLKLLLRDLVGVLFHMPRWLTYIADLWVRLLFHFSMLTIKPVDALKNNKVPILFIHGGADDFIDKKHTMMNYEACTSYKKLEIFETAKHADAYFNDSKRYEQVVSQFLSEIEAL